MIIIKIMNNPYIYQEQETGVGKAYLQPSLGLQNKSSQ